MKRFNSLFITVVCVITLFACKENSMNDENDQAATQVTEAEQKPMECKIEKGCVHESKLSKPLSEISQSSANKLVVTCDPKFKNENGDCEIPNQPHPPELKKKPRENKG